MANGVLAGPAVTDARSAVARGALYSTIAALAVGVGMVAIALLADSLHLYALVLVGVAAGAAMATQMDVKSSRAGLVAAATTAIVAAVILPAVSIGSTVAARDMSVPEAAESLGGFGGAYAHLLETAGPLAWAYIAGALVIAFLFGMALAEPIDDGE